MRGGGSNCGVLGEAAAGGEVINAIISKYKYIRSETTPAPPVALASPPDKLAHCGVAASQEGKTQWVVLRSQKEKNEEGPQLGGLRTVQ